MIYQFDEFVIDTQNYQLSNNGTAVDVEPKVFDLLSYLVVNRSKLVTRDELFDNIWKGQVVSDTSLSNQIKAARKAIGDNGQKQLFIKTVHGRGYQFIAPTEEAEGGKKKESESRITTLESNVRPAIAVIPFTNMSGDPEQEYFSDGISEDIITELARYPNLFVIAPHTSFSFKESSPDIHKIGQDLGVQFVVNGSVRRVEKRVRITAQIQEAKTGKLMWGERYDRDLDDLFAVQDEVTRSIVAALAIRIESETLERAKRKHPGNMGAYDFWLRGKDVLERANTVEGVENAQVLFRKGLALDSGYARLHAGLAEAAYSHAFFRAGPDFLDAVAVAARHAETAIRLDDTDTQPHRVAGWVYMFLREFERAQRHFDAAIAINANDADVLMNWACATALLGQPDDAIEKASTAMRLNPHHPGWYREFVTMIYFSARRYADALSIAATEPDVFPSSPGWRAAASAYIGRDEEAKCFAGELVSRIASDWIGDRPASSRDIVEYLCETVPFRREEDSDHLREGLFLAGLDR